MGNTTDNKERMETVSGPTWSTISLINSVLRRVLAFSGLRFTSSPSNLHTWGKNMWNYRTCGTTTVPRQIVNVDVIVISSV